MNWVESVATHRHQHLVLHTQRLDFVWAYPSRRLFALLLDCNIHRDLFTIHAMHIEFGVNAVNGRKSIRSK